MSGPLRAMFRIGGRKIKGRMTLSNPPKVLIWKAPACVGREQVPKATKCWYCGSHLELNP